MVSCCVRVVLPCVLNLTRGRTAEATVNGNMGGKRDETTKIETTAIPVEQKTYSHLTATNNTLILHNKTP